VINNDLNKTNKHVHHLQLQYKLGNVALLTATSAVAASNTQPGYSDELAFTLTQKLYGI